MTVFNVTTAFVIKSIYFLRGFPLICVTQPDVMEISPAFSFPNYLYVSWDLQIMHDGMKLLSLFRPFRKLGSNGKSVNSCNYHSLTLLLPNTIYARCAWNRSSLISKFDVSVSLLTGLFRVAWFIALQISKLLEILSETKQQKNAGNSCHLAKHPMN